MSIAMMAKIKDLLLSNLSSVICLSQKVFKAFNRIFNDEFLYTWLFQQKTPVFKRSHLNLSILYSNFSSTFVYICTHGYMYVHANKAKQIYTLEITIYQNITHFKATQTIFIGKSNFSSDTGHTISSLVYFPFTL